MCIKDLNSLYTNLENKPFVLNNYIELGNIYFQKERFKKVFR